MTTEREVVVYSTPMCAPCEQLKRFLTEHDVRFVSKDLLMDEDAADVVERSNIRSVPVLGIDGRLYAGADLSRSNLERILGL